MNKTKIEWCDRTWNPITGCLHNCGYCYARGIAWRFDGDTQAYHEHCASYEGNPLYLLDDPVYKTTKKGKQIVDAFPWGFDPTFHRYRLSEPQKIKTPQTVFVGSMCDLFGDWVPDEWIEEVFKACEAAPWHRYMFLTKNPFRYMRLQPESYKNWWFGNTITGNEHADLYATKFDNNFLSVEPIRGVVESDLAANGYNWVIVGAETDGGKVKRLPKREWVQDIVDACRSVGVPVFLKNSLSEVWAEPLIQEFPWEVQT